MIIIGCDFHTRFQQVAMFDPTTGEIVERRLEHETGEARRFYASLSGTWRESVEINKSFVSGIDFFGRSIVLKKLLYEAPSEHKLSFAAKSGSVPHGPDVIRDV